MERSDVHEKYMLRCIELAKCGLGYVAPNPMVGAVVVYNNQIIGEGYHQQYGQAHAEVNAIHSVQNKELLQHSTIYVNLEPCVHFGKTPPCADLLIDQHIGKVVIANIDPFSKVQGKGIEKLKNAGIEVITDILKAEGEELNKRFFTFHGKKRPYVILKWAQTQDGFIDVIREPNQPQQPTWITNEIARMLVHKWRTEEASIMVATNTALKDNPKLNVRYWVGNKPVRIVIDRTLRLPHSLDVFDGSQRTIVVTEKEIKRPMCSRVEYLTVIFNNNMIDSLLNGLHALNIQSIIVEGGSRLLQTFIDSNLWDEARVFSGNIHFGHGVKAPSIPFEPKWVEKGANYFIEIYQSKDI